MKVQPYWHSSAVILSGSVQEKNFPCQINRRNKNTLNSFLYQPVKWDTWMFWTLWPWKAGRQCKRTWSPRASWLKRCCRWSWWPQTHTGLHAKKEERRLDGGTREQLSCCNLKTRRLTLRPLARLMALNGLNTLRTLRIFTTEMALDLQRDVRTVKECLSFF